MTEETSTARGPSPPPIPVVRRASMLASRYWPFVAWCGALAASVWLYRGEPGRGQLKGIAGEITVGVAPSTDGRVERLTVLIGETVTAGQVVGHLDSTELDQRLRTAAARIERMRSRIAAAEARLRLDHGERKRQARARRANFQAEIRRQRLLIDELTGANATDRAEMASLDPRIARLGALKDRKLVTTERLDELRQRSRVLTERVASRVSRLEAARAELVAWKGLAPVPVAEPDVEVQLEPLRLQLEAELARQEDLELRRARYLLIAPATGKVAFISRRAGEWCVAGTPAIEISCAVDRVVAYVRGRRIGRVEVGDRVQVRPLEAGRGRYEGRVCAVAPRVELVPRRLRAMPEVPEWGVAISIEVPGAAPSSCVGTLYDLSFR